MAIRDWPDDERPREKLLTKGAHSLSDAELLAIMLRTGLPGRSALDLARELLQHYGGLRALLEAECESFCQRPGMGPAKYVQFQAVLELGRRYLEESVRREGVISAVADTRRYFIARLRHHPHEVFACLFLDNRHRIIQFEELFRGTIDSSAVHPREVVRRALKHNAAAVIFAHNHPSGVAEPSQADRQITDKLCEALALIDVRVLDHLVVGDVESVSLAERGWLLR